MYMYVYSSIFPSYPCPLTETYDPVDWQEVLPFHLSQVIAEERAKFDKWTSDVKELQVGCSSLVKEGTNLTACV